MEKAKQVAKFTLIIRGNTGHRGAGVGRDLLRFSVLKEQVALWEKMLGNGEDFSVSIEKGARKAVFVLPLGFYNELMADIAILKSGGTDLAIPSRLRWYNRMVRDIKERGWRFRILDQDGREVLNLGENASPIRRKRNNATIKRTRILRGEIVGMGGMPPHIRISSEGKTYVVRTDEALIRKKNLIYEKRSVLVECNYDPGTGKESHFRFVSFVEPFLYEADKEDSNDIIVQEVALVVPQKTAVGQVREDVGCWMSDAGFASSRTPRGGMRSGTFEATGGENSCRRQDGGCTMRDFNKLGAVRLHGHHCHDTYFRSGKPDVYSHTASGAVSHSRAEVVLAQPGSSDSRIPRSTGRER